uniref:Uncharacterized protein n=1 Tax=Oryza rufipogon TaxID=4529 RepID=A0A0E0R687_ORYRU
MAILGLKEFGSGMGDLFCSKKKKPVVLSRCCLLVGKQKCCVFGRCRESERGMIVVWADDSRKQMLREASVICLAMDNISRMESAPAVSADMEWCDEFGLGSEEWTTKVEIKIRNVPEHIKYGTENGVRIKFFMLNLEATPYVDLEKDVVANGKFIV